MKKKYIIILMLFGWISIQAQEQLSLSEAIRIGLEKNYDLQIVRNNQKISEINNTWANTGIMPSLNFSLNARSNSNYNDVEDYNTQTIQPDISLNWIIFNGFSARINKQKFNELEKQSEGNTAILIESTIQDIIMAYNNCLLQKEMIDVYKEMANLSTARYKRALDSKNIGAGTTYESLQAKTSMLEDESNYLKQKVNYENAIRVLNYTLAVDDNKKWIFTTKLNTETTDYKIENLLHKLTNNNNTLKNQYIYQTLLAKETALAKTSYSPSISLNTGLSNTALDNYYSGLTTNRNQNYSDAYVGLTLSWNIFNGGAKKRSIEIAKITQESAMIQTEQMKHSLNNQLLQIYNNYLVQKSILEIAEKQESAAKLNLELSEEKFKNGSINSFNYRDVQIMYMNAAMSKYMAVYDLYQSNTDLLRITGGIINEFKN